MNDINNLPIAKILPRIEATTKERVAIALEEINEIITARNNRKIKAYVQEHEHPESGTEGLEEEAREVLTLEEYEDQLPEPRIEAIRKTVRNETIVSFITHFDLAKKYAWVLPQLMAAVGSWKAIKNDTGKYDGYLTYEHNVENNNLNYGIWLILMQPRNSLIETPKSMPLYKLNRYNGLVPLILSAFKDFQKINYENWDKQTVQWLVNEELYKAMTAEVPEMTPTEINSFREHAQYYKMGRGEAKLQSPISSYAFYHLDSWTSHDLTKVPKLTLHMMCQTWCAHPANRLPGIQILDWKDWDNVPKPIISSNVINSGFDWGTTTKFVSSTAKSPW